MTNYNLFKQRQKSSVKLAVILPVKDEEKGLIATLAALNNQLDGHNQPLDFGFYEILLLANNCTDKSFEIASLYRQQHSEMNLLVARVQLPPEVAHIGTVRRALMDAAYDRFQSNGKNNGIIASTDGDSEVDQYWVYNIMLAMSKNVDVVGGRIIPIATPKLSKLFHLQNVTYRYYVSQLDALLNPSLHDPWPRHFQCFGPSVAVTCDIYERAGRLPAIPFLEDEEFRKALNRIDAKIRMCPSVKVYTSSRLEGKVGFGFSVQLQRWGEMHKNGEKIYVDTLESLSEIFKGKYQLKTCWKNLESKEKMGILTEVSTRLKVDLKWLTGELPNHRYFGTLWERVEKRMATHGKWDDYYPQAPIEDVIIDMRKFFSAANILVSSGNTLQDIA